MHLHQPGVVGGVVDLAHPVRDVPGLDRQPRPVDQLAVPGAGRGVVGAPSTSRGGARNTRGWAAPGALRLQVARAPAGVRQADRHVDGHHLGVDGQLPGRRAAPATARPDPARGRRPSRREPSTPRTPLTLRPCQTAAHARAPRLRPRRLRAQDPPRGWLREERYEVVDHGPVDYDPVDDYPPYVLRAAAAVVNDPGSLGVVIGGSGNGEAIAANKVPGVRAALAWNDDTAGLGREHNDANVVSVGARMHTLDEATRLVERFLTTPFSGDERPPGGSR